MARPPARTAPEETATHGHDKIVRSTHGVIVRCTGSCSWKIYVRAASSPGKPADRLPAHALGPAQPRAARLPWRLLQLVHLFGPTAWYPMVRGRLLERWRKRAQGRQNRSTPWGASPTTTGHGVTTRRCAAWAVSCARAGTRSTEIIAAANVYTVKTVRPRPYHRFLADPRDVDGELCGWAAVTCR